MAGSELIYAFRVMRLPLRDAGGSAIGRIDDIIVSPGVAELPPRVVGFVASSQRRRIFVNAARLASLDGDGARLRSWDLDLNPFKPRVGEVLVGRDLIDRKIGDETVSDVALRRVADSRAVWWEPAKIRLARRGALRPRPTYRLVDFSDLPQLFSSVAGADLAAEVARLRDMHASDVAATVRLMPLSRRKQLAEAMEDERLADLLEELPEDEQLRIIEGLDHERLVDVLEEMEFDDLADLLAEMPGEQRRRVLDALDEEDAETMRRLLSYEEGTAGSLLTPEVIILGPTATVAEALAEIRDPEWMVSIAAQVFVCRPPFKPPTGRYLGVVYFQRLLREIPSLELAHCLEEEPAVTPDMPERDVAEMLATYNLMSIAVADDAGRLLGAITVDDVLDRTLPRNWRQRRRTPGTVS